jgi:hypothetical protein
MFLRLLPVVGKAKPGTRLKGQEEYLTQVMALVLQQNPDLVVHLVQNWCDTTLSSTHSVHAEKAYNVPDRQSMCAIDIVIEDDQHLIFIENKLDAQLNQYVRMTEGEPLREDQLQRYHRTLAKERGDRTGHLLAILQRPPQGDHGDLPMYRGHRFWWDLYEVVRHQLPEPTEDEPASVWLQRELVRFFEQVHLDPPQPLRKDAFDIDHARRCLANVANDLLHMQPRLSTSGVLTLVAGAHTYEAWFTGSAAFQIRRKQAGLVERGLEKAFWSSGIDEQQSQLRELLTGIDEAPLASGDRRTIDAIASRSPGDHDRILRLVATIEQRFGPPMTGTNLAEAAEITFRLPNGMSVRIRPTAKQAFLIFSVGAVHLSDLKDRLTHVIPKLPTSTPKEQYNLPLSAFPEEQTTAVLDAVQPILER